MVYAPKDTPTRQPVIPACRISWMSKRSAAESARSAAAVISLPASDEP